MRTTRLLTALLVVCAFATAASPHAQTPVSMAGYPAVGAPAALTLLSAGAEPRKPLRYTIAPSFSTQVELSTSIAMAINLGPMAMPMDVPTLKTTIELAVTGVAPTGDITYNMSVTDVQPDTSAQTNPVVAMQLPAIMASIKSLKGTSTVSNRGMTKSTKLDMNEPAMQQVLGQVTSSFENVSMPFPEEAVGVGAKWEVRQVLTSGGQTTFEKDVYELVSVDGSNVSLKVTIEQTAPQQAVSNAGLAPGLETSLDKMTGTGTGTALIRLDSLVPTSQLETNKTMAMTASMGGSSQPINAEVKVKVSVAPKVK